MTMFDHDEVKISENLTTWYMNDLLCNTNPKNETYLHYVNYI